MAAIFRSSMPALTLKSSWPAGEGEAGFPMPDDTKAFVAMLGELASGGAASAITDSAEAAAAAGLFTLDDGAQLFVGRAPGRLDVMGGIADYSGSAVLQMPVAQACHVAAQLQPAPTQPRWDDVAGVGAPAAAGEARFRVLSIGGSAMGFTSAVEIPMAVLVGAEDGAGGAGGAGAVPEVLEVPAYAAVRAALSAEAGTAWCAYIVGAAVVLAREKGASFGGKGLTLLVHGAVPDGKGVSSSASVEVASMQAVAAAVGVALPDGRELALLCQKVENFVVGAPCGVMDQMASSMGFPDALMAMDCRPAEVRGAVKIPPHLKFWGVDSGIKHSVGGADYGSVRVGAFMGRRIMAVADAAGAGAEVGAPGTEPYLALTPPHRFSVEHADSLPASMGGAEFLERYGGHGDEGVTAIDPAVTYAVRAPTAHPVFESFRVSTFEQLLGAPDSDAQLAALGELMYQSHASYSLCGVGSAGTDELVELCRASAGPLFGAKITGGGSGGTVCILGRNSPEGEAAVADLVATYKASSGHEPFVFSGSSLGAHAFGALVATLSNQ